METFMAVYKKHFLRIREEQGNKRLFDEDKFLFDIKESLIARDNRFAKDGPSAKATFKELKIKNTWKDIYRFIDNHK